MGFSVLHAANQHNVTATAELTSDEVSPGQADAHVDVIVQQ